MSVQVDLNGEREHYPLDCPYCDKHFEFDFDDKYVYVRPFYFHLAYDHPDICAKELKK